MFSKKIILSFIAFLICQPIFADDLSQTILATHNKFRARHHAPALVWDSQLAAYAKSYASQCQFKHSYGPYGENLAAGFPSAEAAVEAWYNENEFYSYWRPGFSHETGHFTQLVWKSSKKLGCAYVACNGKNGTHGHYLVCEYSPKGNIITGRRFTENVLPKEKTLGSYLFN